MYYASPAEAPARAARARLDELRALVRETPLAMDRAGLQERLARALSGLYAVLDSAIDAPVHRAGLVQAVQALAEARGLLARAGDPAVVVTLARALTLLDGVIIALRGAEAQVADLQLARREHLRAGLPEDAALPVRPMRASVGLPRLHAPPRGPLVPSLSLEPTVDVPAPPAPRRPRAPKPTTIEELRAAAEAALAPPPEPEPEPDAEPLVSDHVPTLDEREVVRRIALDCLEDLAILSTLRKPNPTETWLDQAPFEQRLLDNLDAFVALGEVALPSVLLFHAEAAAPDAARGFAVAFTLGCLEGADAVDVAVAALKESSPEEHAGWAEGFCLAPSPAIDAAMAELLESPRAPLAGLALDVLTARGALPARAVDGLLARGEPGLTLRVARALGRATSKPTAVERLAPLATPDASDDLFLAATESLLLRGEGGARELLRGALATSPSARRRAAAAVLLALTGRAADLDALLQVLAREPSPALAMALGRFGHVGALDPLIALLRADDEELAGAAAEALDRITGAGLREKAQVPWNTEPPEGGAPPPMREIERVIVDASVWQHWRARGGARLDPRVKLRGGAPFSPAMIAAELAAPSTPPGRRADVALELALVTGLPTRFSPTDWVARQHEHLAELTARVAALPGDRGAWWFGGASSTGR